MRSRLSLAFVVIVASVVITVSLPALAEQPTFSSRPASYVGSSPALPPPGDPVNLVLDDGVLENNIGLNSTASATQFLWLNRFSPTEFPIEVSRIDIWWASVGTGIVGGESIELVVYEGGADPCTGATTIVGGEPDHRLWTPSKSFSGHPRLSTSAPASTWRSSTAGSSAA
jgi:hypothetical protein